LANLFSRLRGGGEAERSLSGQLLPYSLGQLQADIATGLNFGGQSYGPFLNQTYGGGSSHEEIPPTFTGLLEMAYKANPVVYGCVTRRMNVFTEARFQFQRIKNGRPSDLFGTTDLAIIENPWPGGTTGDLLARAELYNSLAGNFYAYVERGQIFMPRPDWMHIILGSRSEPDFPSMAWDAEILGYVYQPPNGEPKTFLREEVAHYAPSPDPAAKYRGMSWLQPVIREVTADGAMTTHQIKYFENGATPNMVVSLDSTMNQTAFERWIAAFRNNNEGLANAYKTMYLAGGADAKVVGSNLEDFKTVKGHGETRIALAAGVPAVIAGISEGLEGSSLNAGNFSAARRLFADTTIRPLWRNFAASMETIVNVPGGARLWFDDRDVPFLAEDQKDKAENLAQSANTMHTLIAGGYTPDSVTLFMESGGDYTLLEHSGLYSVQLQPAGSITEGKGSVVQGVAVAKGTNTPAVPPGQASPKQNSADDGVLGLLRLAAGEEAPKYASGGVVQRPPKRDDELVGVLRALAERQSDVNITVEPANAPEVRVEAPVTHVNVPDTHINVEAQDAPVVNVTMPEQAAPVTNVTLPEQPAPVTNVTVEAAEPAEPAHVTVNVPEQPAPVTNVTLPDQPAPVTHVTVEAQPAAEPPVVNVNVPEQEAPVVNVKVDAPTPDAPTINVNVPEQAAPVVNVDVPAPAPVDPPVVNVNVDVPEPTPPKRSLKVKRGPDGEITGIEE